MNKEELLKKLEGLYYVSRLCHTFKEYDVRAFESYEEWLEYNQSVLNDQAKIAEDIKFIKQQLNEIEPNN